MNREVVQNHDLSRTQAGSQDLFDVGFEGDSIRRAIQQHRFAEACEGQRRDQGQVGSVVAGNRADGPLAPWGVGVQRRHVDARTRFIHDHQILRRQLLGLFPPGSAFRLILFAGSQNFFFRVQPKAILARLMEAGLTLVPVLASHVWQCCSLVASG